jgi:hypothetical protein
MDGWRDQLWEAAMSERKRLLGSIGGIIADYRAGEIPRPTPEHVDQWVSQFGNTVQQPILTEMEHVLGKTYLSKAAVENFLKKLVRNPKLAGTDPASFWRSVTFLDIQGGGNNQREMLALFSSILQNEYGFTVSQCGITQPTAFIYLDDVLFTGNRILKDLTKWIDTDAPASAIVHVITIGLHSGGQHYAQGRVNAAARAAQKTLSITWWRAVEIEDRKDHTDTSDVLRPTTIPNDPLTEAYVTTLVGYPPVLRKPGNVGPKAFFSSETGRNSLEQEFLKTGAFIRSICPHLNAYQRPLGNMVLKTTGFGSLVVTFRNCPINTPLALWAGNPWYPLFARKTN